MAFEKSALKREDILQAINMPFDNDEFSTMLYEKYTGKITDPIDYSLYIDKYKRAQLMDEVVSTSGKIKELVIYLEYGRTTKVVNTNVLGQGAFGFVLQDKVTNTIYKIIKVKNNTNINDNFESIIHEITITNILNKVSYPYIYQGTDGKSHTVKVPAAPLCTNLYLVDGNETSYQEANTILFILECTKLNTLAETILETTHDFVKIFTDFLFLVKGIHDAKVYYNHCDVKLNNLMYDTNNRLRFIDFGYSSMYFQTKEGDHFKLFTKECGWDNEHSYMYEKDVIQLLLSSYSVYKDLYFDIPSENLVNNLLFKLSLFRKRDKLQRNFYLPRKNDPTKLNAPDMFQLSYNFQKKIRTFLHGKGDQLQWANPEYLFPVLTSEIFPATSTTSFVHRMKRKQLLTQDITKIVAAAPKKSAKKVPGGGSRQKYRTTRRRRNE